MGPLPDLRTRLKAWAFLLIGIVRSEAPDPAIEGILKAGVGRNTIWRLEHGVVGAQPRTIRKLAKALDVQPEELVKTEG